MITILSTPLLYHYKNYYYHHYYHYYYSFIGFNYYLLFLLPEMTTKFKISYFTNIFIISEVLFKI